MVNFPSLRNHAGSNPIQQTPKHESFPRYKPVLSDRLNVGGFLVSVMNNSYATGQAACHNFRLLPAAATPNALSLAFDGGASPNGRATVNTGPVGTETARQIPISRTAPISDFNFHEKFNSF